MARPRKRATSVNSGNDQPDSSMDRSGISGGNGVGADAVTAATTNNSQAETQAAENQALDTNVLTLEYVDKPKTRRPRKASTEASGEKLDSDKVAGMIVNVLQQVAVNAISPEAAFTDQELVLINTALPAVLDDLGSEAVGQAMKIVNPVALMAGLGMWAIRSYAIFKRDRTIAASRPQVQNPPANQKTPDVAHVIDASDSKVIPGLDNETAKYIAGTP